MSEYMKLKAQIEELQRQAEKARLAEIEVEVLDMRKRIVAFGITRTQLFPHDKETASNAGRKAKYPMVYAWQGKQWSGQSTRPQWFRDALAMGVTKEQMTISNQRNATPPQ